MAGKLSSLNVGLVGGSYQVSGGVSSPALSNLWPFAEGSSTTGTTGGALEGDSYALDSGKRRLFGGD